MRDWREVLISPSTSIVSAIEIIDVGSLQIALVADSNGRLAGTVTDGDIRRGILKKISLDSPVQLIMNPTPTVAHHTEDRESILEKMRSRAIRQIPIVNDDGVIVNLEVFEDLVTGSERENWVVLMAGGVGSRLRPLTDECPKPLLKIGDKPLLETILGNFVEHGFRKFFISVNYKAEMVKEYFGDGAQWDVDIRYLEETEKLGTAGCLSLLPGRPKNPLIVMNGDLLTKVNFQHLLDFHTDHGAMATMCVREYDFQVPYGVAIIENGRMLSIDEKPVQRFFVNAGIYVLDPTAIDSIAKRALDMPTLLEQIVKEGHETLVFPIREYWLDVGRMDDFERANGDFSKNFQ